MTKRIGVAIVVIGQDLAVVAAIGGGGIGAALDPDHMITMIAEVGLVEATVEVVAAAGPPRRAIVGKNPSLQLPPSPLGLAFTADQVGVVLAVVEEG